MIERCIDYLQFTANFNEQDFATDEYIFERGVQFYPRAYRDASGCRFCFGENKGMACLVILSGQTLNYLRSADVSDFEILEWARKWDAKFSRLDLAVTEYIEEDFFTMETVQAWWARGLIESPLVAGGMKKIASVELDWRENIETIYIGDMDKRAKKGIFRAYDKSLEMGIGNEIVSRIELELKREKAHNTALRLLKTNDIAGNFRSSFNVKSLDFERIMDADAVPTMRGQGKQKSRKEDEMDKRWAWLLEQVAPALREAIESDIALGLGESRLMQFASRAGIVERANQFANSVVEFKSAEMERELTQLKQRFSTMELD